MTQSLMSNPYYPPSAELAVPQNEASQGHPKGLYTLFGAEAWERFSYYGMRALLVLYLTKSVGLTKDNALQIYGVYTGLVYVTPLLGGYLADKILGRRKAVLIGGLVMALGHLAMAVPSLLYVALALLIVGNGFFKPNISTMVGGLYSEGDNRRDGAFTIFYMGINLGALWSPIVCGTLGEKVSWHVGFAAAAVGMTMGLLQFGWGQSNLHHTGLPPGRAPSPGTTSMLAPKDYTDVALWTLGSCAVAWGGVVVAPVLSDSFVSVAAYAGFVGSALDAALFKGVGTVVLVLASSLPVTLTLGVGLFRGAGSQEKKQLAVVVILCLFNIFFWMGFEQAGGTMTLFAEDKTNRMIGPLGMVLAGVVVAACTYNFWLSTKDEPSGKGLWLTLSAMFGLLTVGMFVEAALLALKGAEVEVPASLFQSVNPMVIVAFAPTFSRLWTWLDGTKFRLSIPSKMAVGMVVLGLGFVVLFAGQKVGEMSGAKISMAWLVAVYVIHTLGELCLSPVGLSMVTKLAPARVASLAMGMWLGSSAVANYLAGTLEHSLEGKNIPIYAFLIASSIVPALLLMTLNPILKKWMGPHAY